MIYFKVQGWTGSTGLQGNELYTLHCTTVFTPLFISWVMQLKITRTRIIELYLEYIL